MKQRQGCLSSVATRLGTRQYTEVNGQLHALVCRHLGESHWLGGPIEGDVGRNFVPANFGTPIIQLLASYQFFCNNWYL